MLDDFHALRLLLRKRKGGPGSGHFGHRGRPGQRGGSLPGGAGMAGNPVLSIINPGELGTKVHHANKPWTKEDRKPTKLQIRKVEENMRRIPILHQELADDVYVVNDYRVKPVDAAYGEVKTAFQRQGFHKKDAYIAGVAVQRRGSHDIYIAGRGLPAKTHASVTIAHEVGHMVFPTKMDTAMRRNPVSKDQDFNFRRRAVADVLSKRFVELNKTKGRFVTYYSKTNTSEYMSECYGHYVAKPKVLKRIDPVAYDAMKALFEGQEYM